jgi:hypothetical protein
MRRGIAVLSVLFSACSLYSHAQQWSPVLNSSQAINWSNSGVGGIPARTTNCASLTSSASVSQINSALAACPSGQTVSLAAGTYSISGSITIPSNVTLRGAGANSTVLNATGGGGNVINLGTGSASYNPLNITGGATSGSTSISVSNASGVKTGMYLVIAETNNSSYVSNNGSEGACTWCDGWSTNGNLSRGQIVAVTGVSGSSVTISPGLYGAYTNSPIAVPFNMSASYAGVENLQVYANNTGHSANFGMSACAYCWIKGVESNYTDGDHVDVYWGYRDEVRDSYFSNAYLHEPGSHDSDIDLAYKTSATLVENNIVERTHASIMMEWGAAGNVIAYNYTSGEFDSGSTNFVIGGVSFHGAHPQFNLLEGNVLTQIYPDSVWGTSSQTTAFRNWVVGTNRVCSPLSGRGTVSCSGSNGHYAFQAARAMQMSYLTSKNNFVGNVVGSSQMQSLTTNNGSALSQAASVEYPATRSYDSVAYGWSFGYGESSDDGSGSGCSGGSSPCHRAGTSANDFSHGNFSNAGGAISWASGVTQSLPSSFYLSGKPAWWGSLSFPATGPDVSGGSGPGGHSYGNPAEACYLNVMKGSDGGAGGPFTFNASTCYGSGAGGGTSPGPAAPQGLTGVVH